MNALPEVSGLEGRVSGVLSPDTPLTSLVASFNRIAEEMSLELPSLSIRPLAIARFHSGSGGAGGRTVTPLSPSHTCRTICRPASLGGGICPLLASERTSSK